MRKLKYLFFCLILISFSIANAQTKTVSGKIVSSEDGEPVIGATVMAKGTTEGTVTDTNGLFSLSFTSPTDSLVISSANMKTTELLADSNLLIKLMPDKQAANEVIVTAYGTSTKGSFTGSVGVINSDNIERRQASNVTNVLTGNIPGVQVLNNNGQPGTTSSVYIRGISSINAGTNPLYLVDGVPFDGDLSAINPYDIQSITVLKDAVSTSLYGARGADGIVVITTKQGKKGQTKISFDTKIGVNSREITNYKVLTNSKDYLETEYQAIYNAAIYNLSYNNSDANNYANTKLISNTDGGNGYQIYTVPAGQILIGSNGKLNPYATLGYSDATYYYTPDNWANSIFKNGIRQEYNLAMSGGNDNGNFYASLGYLDNYGTITNSGFSRLSGKLRGDYKIKKWLKVGANINYSYTNYKFPKEQTSTNSSDNAFYIANYIAPIYPIYVRDASTHNVMSQNGRLLYDYGDAASTNFSRSFMSASNPLGNLTYNKTNYLSDVINDNFFVEIMPVKDLTFTARYGLYINNMRFNDLGNAYMGQNVQYGGTAYQSMSRTYGLDQQYFATYKQTINKVHNLDYTLGFDSYTYQYDYLYGSGSNLYDPESYFVSNAIDNIMAGGYENQYANAGIIGRLNYNYGEQYFISFGLRRDGSSRFAPENRWGNFWSGSAAWLISKGEFWKNVNWMNMLKFKLSYGIQGNDAIGNYYAYLDQFSRTESNGNLSDGTVASLTYKGNKDLTWETSKSFNTGFDFAVLSNRLTGTVEYYSKQSGNMLYYKPTAPSSVYTKIPINAGSMTNSGIEVDLHYDVIKNANMIWNIYVNGTFNKNIINELYSELNGRLIDGNLIYEKGYSMYRYYIVKYAGVDKTTGLAQYWALNDSTNQEYKTSNWSIANSTDRTGTKNLLPKVYGGFGTSVQAYGFDASIQLSYQLGGTIYDKGYQNLMHGGSSDYAGQNWSVDILNAWTTENTDTDVPRLDANDMYANSTSTRFLISSNYLSLDNVTVGYTVPKKMTDKINIKKLRFYCTADNVGLLTARKGLDPRQSYTLSTTARYTAIRTISGGLTVNF